MFILSFATIDKAKAVESIVALDASFVAATPALLLPAFEAVWERVDEKLKQ